MDAYNPFTTGGYDNDYSYNTPDYDYGYESGSGYNEDDYYYYKADGTKAKMSAAEIEAVKSDEKSVMEKK